MRVSRRLVRLVFISSVVVPSSAEAGDSLAVAVNATCVLPPSACQWISVVGSHVVLGGSDTPITSFTTERQCPPALIRGGGIDDRSSQFLCRTTVVSSGPYVEWSNTPYSRWWESYKSVRSFNDMSDDDDEVFFTSHSTCAEGLLQTTSSEPEPSLPAYPDGFPGETAAAGYVARREEITEDGGRPLLHLVGDDFSESEQEMISQRLSHSSQRPEGESETDDQRVPHSPVVYRYFGRSRVRTHRTDSIPFILLGPCVDHWKSVGQILANRGFNVMACEREEDAKTDVSAGGPNPDVNSDESENLVLAVLDALRWKRAVLVGCDDESILAIEAALRLSPDRVVGLVLCGDLVSANDYVERLNSSESDGRDSKPVDFFSVDAFVRDHLDCPCTVIWDGGIPKVWRRSKTAAGSMLADCRSLVLGGGSAPHRRNPEMFAWMLTRFMEEKVVPQIYPQANSHQTDAVNLSEDQTLPGRKNRIRLPYNELFSPGTFLVAGRLAAAAIFYITALKVAVYQYENVRSGVISLRSGYETVSSWRKWFLQAFFNIFNFGSLFGRQKAAIDEENSETASMQTEQDDDATDDNDENLGRDSEIEEDQDDAPSEHDGVKTPVRIDYLDRIIV